MGFETSSVYKKYGRLSIGLLSYVNTMSWIRHSDTTLLLVWSSPLKLGNQQKHLARCLHTQMSSSSCVPRDVCWLAGLRQLFVILICV